MDAASLLRTFGSLGAVLGLLMLALWAARRYNLRLPGAPQGHGTRRLTVVERVALDPRRSVALIRRDGCEHLLLISPEGHQMLETAIAAPAPAPTAASNFAALVETGRAAQDRPSPLRDAADLLEVASARIKPLFPLFRARIDQAQRWLGSHQPARPTPRPAPARPARAKTASPAKRRARPAKAKQALARG